MTLHILGTPADKPGNRSGLELDLLMQYLITALSTALIIYILKRVSQQHPDNIGFLLTCAGAKDG